MKKTIAFLTGIVCIFRLTDCKDGGNNERSSESSRISCDTISVGAHHTLGLKSDGTVVSTTIVAEENDWGQCDVSDWTNIRT